MPLQAFNVTGTPVTLAAGRPARVLPASVSPPGRGPAVNVTSELRPNLTVDPARGVAGGLTAAEYLLLQAQAASVVLEWTGTPEYTTGALATSGPVPGMHASAHAKGGGDALDIQDLGSGLAALGKLFAADGAGGVSLVDPSGLPTGVGFTSEGGRYVTMTNKTGAPSVKGSVVAPSSSTSGGFQLSATPYYDPIGIVYENGIADGSPCKIVLDGPADVLIKDGTAATRKYWVGPSDVAGRADASSVSPPGGTIAALENHFKEIGHALETKGSGTNVLVRCMLHFC